MAQWVGVQGLAKESKNTPTFGVPPENPSPKTKYIFRFPLEDLVNP